MSRKRVATVAYENRRKKNPADRSQPFRVGYLDAGAQRTHLDGSFSLADATRQMRSLKRQGRTAWVESAHGEFVPVTGAMRQPKFLREAAERREANPGLQWEKKSSNTISARSETGLYVIERGHKGHGYLRLQGLPLGTYPSVEAAQIAAQKHADLRGASECPCPHGEYGKSVEHHLQKMGSPDPAHDLKHSADYVGRCQTGGIDPGMCAAVIYGAVHHSHPPSSHMTEAEEGRHFAWMKNGDEWSAIKDKYYFLATPIAQGWWRVNLKSGRGPEVLLGFFSSLDEAKSRAEGYYQNVKGSTVAEEVKRRQVTVSMGSQWREGSDGDWFKVEGGYAWQIRSVGYAPNPVEWVVFYKKSGDQQFKLFGSYSLLAAAKGAVQLELDRSDEARGGRYYQSPFIVWGRNADNKLWYSTATSPPEETREDKAAFRWAEVWFEQVSDGSLFVSRIEKIDSTIVADLSGHVVTTNATEHDVDKVLAKGGYKERFVKMDSVRRAAEEPVRWWLVVFSQLNGERGEIHVRARTADDALAKAQQDAQIDLSKQVRTIQLKSGARPDLSMGGPSPHAYEDFVAVDATGRVIGTPHKEYYRAKQEAGQTGFVKYVSPTALEANDSAVSENTWLVVVRGVGTEDTGIPHVISSHRTEREAERARKAERDRSSPYSGDQLFDIAKKLPDGQIKIMPPSQLREDSAPACQPFTRVERDPAKFNACMLRAKEVGPIQGSRKIYDLVHADIEKLDEEHFLVLCLDFRGQVRDYVEINVGQRHRVATEVEDILRPIILSGCDGAVVIHNHPSGDAHPSEADDKLTDSIREAMRIACPGITLLDHVVIGRGQYFSYADKKLHKV